MTRIEAFEKNLFFNQPITFITKTFELAKFNHFSENMIRNICMYVNYLHGKHLISIIAVDINLSIFWLKCADCRKNLRKSFKYKKHHNIFNWFLQVDAFESKELKIKNRQPQENQ